jgi:class 3 adenylate cyclase
LSAFGSRAQETITLVAAAIVLAIAVHRARRIVLAQALAEQDRDMISRTFGQYVPKPVAEALIADRGVIAPREHLATVLFLDLQGFTSITETKSPNRVIAMLNGFFDAVGAAIAHRNGVVIQFIGDAVMATFNAPLPDPEHASNALRAACDIRALTRERTFEGVSLGVRIGISTGPIAAGSVGGSGRQAYTVYGDTVNLAARLEVLNKEYGTWLLASEATAQAADLEIAFRKVGPASIRGKQRPITLYTIEP